MITGIVPQLAGYPHDTKMGVWAYLNGSNARPSASAETG
jgi:hypothetical protein